MPIADDRAFVVLDYIERLNSVGCRPTLEQVMAYARNPFRQTLAIFSLSSYLRRKLVDWLHGNKWIEYVEDESTGDDKPVAVTALGRCTLSALRKAQMEAPSSSIIVFRDGTPFNYAEFFSRLPDADFLLVDPYFKEVMCLQDLVSKTQCRRILAGSKLTPQEKNSLSIALREIPAEQLDIRIARESIHDRFVIPDSGAVSSLGTSVNGLKKHFSVMASLEEPWSDTIRAWHNDRWDSAQTLREQCTKSGSSSS